MSKRMGLAAAAQFCRRAGTSFRAGVDIVALCRSETRHGSTRQQAVMNEVSQRVAQGETLTVAMTQADPRFFPRLLIAMVRLGEETGRLERTLLELADHYQHRLEVRRNFLRAISLPALQFGIALMALGLLIWITGFLPTGQSGEPFDVLGLGLYGNRGVALYFLFLAAVAGLFWLAYQAVRNNWLNLQAAVPLLYHIPKLGPALQTITLAKFTWTLAMSSDAGLDPFRAVELALDSTGSEYYRSETETAHRAIRQGETLEGALRHTGIFPTDFLHELEVAELSGTQAESLAHLADRYDERAKAAVGVIGVVATGAILVTFSGILIFLIIRMALNVLGVYDEALDMVR
jgi:type II secretory pathway component PulF